MAVVKVGKKAVTEYTLITQFDYLALIRLKLHTGRTHQIRVHLAHVNHPVFGDPTYNGRHLIAGPGTPAQKAEVAATSQAHAATGAACEDDLVCAPDHWTDYVVRVAVAGRYEGGFGDAVEERALKSAYKANTEYTEGRKIHNGDFVIDIT